ncbi:MAG: hypothetical protein IJ510_01620 [Selenomonadales bacterium]|nr:hypothetical protein [Selenomonadales bacterium]
MKKKMREAMRMGYLMPCYRFRDATNSDQLMKTADEVDEIVEAMLNYLVEPSRENRMALLMECADVQVCIETLMHNLGADEYERMEARRCVWKKNDDRGYYDEER